MTTVAAGLAKSGFLPFTYTIASFNTYKIVEQIKLDICYPNLPVVIVGVGSGLSYSNLGTTHHSIEDIAVLNGINNLQIVCPADPKELKVILPQIIKSKKPTYLKMGKKTRKIYLRINVIQNLEYQLKLRKVMTFVYLAQVIFWQIYVRRLRKLGQIYLLK